MYAAWLWSNTVDKSEKKDSLVGPTRGGLRAEEYDDRLPPGMPRGIGDVPGMRGFEEPGFNPGRSIFIPERCPAPAQVYIAPCMNSRL